MSTDLNVECNVDPVVDSHIRRVEERIVFVNRVNDAICFSGISAIRQSCHQMHNHNHNKCHTFSSGLFALRMTRLHTITYCLLTIVQEI